MPRTKGSKNKPKTVTADFAIQIAEKQSARESFSAEIKTYHQENPRGGTSNKAKN